MLKIIISGGGTGGHIFPAISIANEIRSRYPDADILFVGVPTSRGVVVTRRGMTQRCYAETITSRRRKSPATPSPRPSAAGPWPSPPSA